MSRFRFSIKYLLLLVALVAGGCAALTSRSVVWAYIVCVLVGLLLVFMPVVAIYGRGGLRRFAGGCSVAAWLYALIAFYLTAMTLMPGLHFPVTRLLAQLPQQEPQLPPTPSVAYPPGSTSTTYVAPAVMPWYGIQSTGENYPWDIDNPAMSNSEWYYLYIVGHALAAMVVGFLAGVLAVVLAPAEKGAGGGSGGAG